MNKWKRIGEEKDDEEKRRCKRMKKKMTITVDRSIEKRIKTL